MNRLILLGAASAALALSAHADTKTYDLGSFSELNVSRGVKVVYTAGTPQNIRAETEEGDFDKLRLEVDGDALVVSRKNLGLSGRGNRKHSFTVYITSPTVSEIEASSGSRVEASGVGGEDVSLQASSGASLDVEAVQGTDVSASASSGASLDIAGECASFEVSSSSGSSVDAEDLRCTAVEAKASSGSSIGAHATEKAHGKASSGASIDIEGGATEVSREKSSGGSVDIN